MQGMLTEAQSKLDPPYQKSYDKTDHSFSRFVHSGRTLYRRSGSRGFVGSSCGGGGGRGQQQNDHRCAGCDGRVDNEGRSTGEASLSSSGAFATTDEEAEQGREDTSSIVGRKSPPSLLPSTFQSATSTRKDDSRGPRGPRLRYEFVESTSLRKDRSSDYQSFGSFKAVVMFPYAYTQFWFFELYQIGTPIFLPSRKILPLYLGQDFIRFQFYVMAGFSSSLSTSGERKGDEQQQRQLLEQAESQTRKHNPVHEYHPFLEHANLKAFLYWTQFCEWVTWPHITEFDSLRVLVEHFNPRKDAASTLAATSRKMRLFSQKMLMDNASKWRAGLSAILAVPLGDRQRIQLTSPDIAGGLGEGATSTTLGEKSAEAHPDDGNQVLHPEEDTSSSSRSSSKSISVPYHEGSFFHGDLSTHQPCGGTPGREDSPAHKANDGNILTDHPNEYHTRDAEEDTTSSEQQQQEKQKGQDVKAFWWVQLREYRKEVNVTIWNRDCCTSQMASNSAYESESSASPASPVSLELRIAVDSNRVEDSLYCGKIHHIADGGVQSAICSFNQMLEEEEGSDENSPTRSSRSRDLPSHLSVATKQETQRTLEEVGANILFIVNRESPVLMLPEVLVSDMGWVVSSG
ncbi:unnamed protein product [Amoebophrya sp. A25]|nr:unnamed protein product [Amoebophrya sp. A25]|eukprot:GSA25T00009322001.1